MSTRSGSTAVFQVPGKDLGAEGCTSVWCELEALATEPGVITAAALLGVLALLAFAYIRDAEAACRGERRRVLDERDAFETFAERVSEMDPAPAPTDPNLAEAPAGVLREMSGRAGTGTGPPEGGGVRDVTLRRVMAAYRDTVLSLPHYRAEYDETVAQSLAAELGPDTVTALATDGSLSSGAQSALVSRSRRAADARGRLADAIGSEIEALSRAESSLSTIDRRRGRLVEHLDGISPNCETEAAIDVWHRLDELEAECDALAADRQAALDDPPMRPGPEIDDDPRAFYGYLYDPSDGPRYPVLAQVTDLAERIRADKAHIGSRIAGGD